MENVYANNIPALHPLASGVDEIPAQAIARGEPLALQDVTAARLQHQNRKYLAMYIPALITGDELVASKRRKHIVQSSNFDGPVPAWAQQMQATQREMQAAMQVSQQAMQATQLAMQATQREMQVSLQRLEHSQVDMEVTQLEILDALQMVTRRQNEESQRGMNRWRRHTNDPIVPLLRLLDGDEPDADRHGLWFPQNQEQLLGATGPRVTALLAFYDLDVRGTLGEKKNRLMAHLGVSAP